eukprot:GFKZ01009149.1.p1 GENE.GFKZ01009149.1~~GFKZ01009149.1.p1  ORF type:complete len:252 (-),score=13.37 GFKZ01009149.1:296-1051(-)
MTLIQKDPTFSQYFKGGQTISVFSLLLTLLNPIPEPLSSSFRAFSSSLGAKLDAAGVNPSHYLLYSEQSFHCSVATLHHYSSPPPHNSYAVTKAWGHLVENFIQSEPWPPFNTTYLRVTGVKVFPDGVVVFLYEDHDHVIFTLRRWLENMRTQNQSHHQGTDPYRVRIPAIYHSTVLRWRETPIVENSGFSTKQLQSLADAAFKETFEPGLVVQVNEASVVREYLPYMQEWTRTRTVPFGSVAERNISSKH